MWMLLTLGMYSDCYTFVSYILKGDVYPVEPMDGLAFNQVLDAHWGVLNDEDVRMIFYSFHTLHPLL